MWGIDGQKLVTLTLNNDEEEFLTALDHHPTPTVTPWTMN